MKPTSKPQRPQDSLNFYERPVFKQPQSTEKPQHQLDDPGIEALK